MTLHFSQLCEYLTSKQTASWFYISQELLDSCAPEELSLVHVERLSDGFIRCHYPKEKYVEPTKPKPRFSREQLQKQLIEAAMSQNQDEVLRISELLK
jgi:hypothetical protein